MSLLHVEYNNTGLATIHGEDGNDFNFQLSPVMNPLEFAFFVNSSLEILRGDVDTFKDLIAKNLKEDKSVDVEKFVESVTEVVKARIEAGEEKLNKAIAEGNPMAKLVGDIIKLIDNHVQNNHSGKTLH